MANNNVVFHDENDYKLLMASLRTAGISKVVVDFQGGGDSGSIEDIAFFDARGELYPSSNRSSFYGNQDINAQKPSTVYDAQILWPARVEEFDEHENKWKVTTTHNQLKLTAICERICEKALDESGLDWYNNEGGSGNLTIDLTCSPPQLSLYVGVNETITHEHSFVVNDNFGLSLKSSSE